MTHVVQNPYKSYISWLVGLLAVVLYLPSLGYGFVLDDAIVIIENDLVRQGISGVWDIFTHDSFFGFFGDEGKAQLVAGGRYRPLSIALFAFVYQFFGASPWVYHLLSIVIYGLCCTMVYRLLALLLHEMKSPASTLLALAATLVYVAHPVHVECVANIKGIDESLSALLALLALLIASKKDITLLHWGLSAVAMFFALMAKEHVAILLVLAPLLWWTVGRSPIASWWRRWSGLAVATGLYLGCRLLVIGRPELSATSPELMNNPMLHYVDGDLVMMSFFDRLGTNAATYLNYLKLLILPHPLCHDYYPRSIPVQSISSIKSLVSLLIHLGLVAAAIRYLWKSRTSRTSTTWMLVSFGVLWYMLSMLLYTNMLFTIGTHMGERFLFFSSIGFVIALMGVVSHFMKDKPASLLLGVLALIFTGLSLVRMPAWKNNYTLFTTDVQVNPMSAKLQNAAAGTLLSRYERQPKDAKSTDILLRALAHAEKALEIHPKYTNAMLLQGNAMLYLGRYEAAISSYEHLLRLAPRHQDGNNNLHIALIKAGRHYGEEKGDLLKSISYLERALAMKKDDAETLRLLGTAHGMKGDHQAAAKYFERLHGDYPDQPRYMGPLSNAYHHLGRTEERDRLLQRIEQLKDHQ